MPVPGPDAAAVGSPRLRATIGALRRRITGAPGDGDAGSAVIEFVVLGTLLLVPVVYLILSLGAVQAGSFAVVGAADQAAKMIALSEEQLDAGAADAAAATTMADFGFDRGAWTVDVACSEPRCSEPGSRVTVTVRLTVPLPMAPSIGGSVLSAATVQSSATEILGRFR
ncbi:hypothetical protein [Tersicoccus sp. Bi-70]|uniref:hypothetical protein n=1 Tax=Tersicoccus sp. Bi-70 TaxID=1897634 RepID=UPI0009F9177C|nr:hypothetical protein [Tersicoccus sp. Bi-70]